ncbi:hypothetical protein L1987_55032 [Smallanthus sonchifolius]|uniref:Uncharacterized protein n=1 Tax=Smallanthus sonchifolius TaxID=185202 RepID=A0ACB9E8X4_9ASTR|nr:hypothetical protein L1987_55032 [Smallanthus sonchifolius]
MVDSSPDRQSPAVATAVDSGAEVLVAATFISGNEQTGVAHPVINEIQEGACMDGSVNSTAPSSNKMVYFFRAEDTPNGHGLEIPPQQSLSSLAPFASLGPRSSPPPAQWVIPDLIKDLVRYLTITPFLI